MCIPGVARRQEHGPMKRIRASAASAAFVAAALAVSAAEAQGTGPRYSDDAARCMALAEQPAIKTRANAYQAQSDELQKQLPQLLERFAAQPELQIALRCLMNTSPAR
jgi:hypothetical protein